MLLWCLQALKSLEVIERQYSYTYYMHADDDSYVRLDLVLQLLVSTSSLTLLSFLSTFVRKHGSQSDAPDQFSLAGQPLMHSSYCARINLSDVQDPSTSCILAV